MATLYWRGKASAVAQVDTVTVGGTIGSETFTLTVGGVDLAVSATGGDTAADVAAALADVWNASTHPYAAAVTASANSAAVTLTADVAGVPFTVTAAATGSATLVAANSTASAGPNDWSTPANWSTGSVPTDGDTVVLADSATPVWWGLDQASVAVAELRVDLSYVGTIGLPDDRFTLSDAAASDAANEYRDAALAIGATAVRIGEHAGAGQPAGPSRVRLNTGSGQTTLSVIACPLTSGDGEQPVVRWVGTHASNVVHVLGGSVGIASTPGETATVATLNVGQVGDALPAVEVGPGVTLTTLNQHAGRVHLAADAATVRQSGGELATAGSAAVTTCDVAGDAQLDATGTLGTLRVLPRGVADFSANPQPRTVTNCELHHGATLNVDSGAPLHITFTNDIDLIRCGVSDVNLISGSHLTLSLAAIA